MLISISILVGTSSLIIGFILGLLCGLTFNNNPINSHGDCSGHGGRECC